jgi:hypothetical protein
MNRNKITGPEASTSITAERAVNADEGKVYGIAEADHGSDGQGQA